MPTMPLTIKPMITPVGTVRVDDVFLRIMSKLIQVDRVSHAYEPPERLEGIIVGGPEVTPKTLIESKSMNEAAEV